MRWLVACLVVAVSFGGCSAPAPDDMVEQDMPAPQFPLVLQDRMPPRDDVLQDSRDERRSDLRAPGFPLYAPADAAMLAYMEDRDIEAGALAVIRNGKLLYENGYGTTDGSTEAPPDALFRVASLSKTVTNIIARMVAKEGAFSWDDRVFCVQPAPDPTCILSVPVHDKRPIIDERVANITVQHLTDHASGWDSTSCSPDYDGEPMMVAETLGIASPPPVWRNVQWLLGEPIRFDPGEDYAYCNLGYRILGLVIEATTGYTLSALEQAYVFGPLDIAGHIEPGRTLPEKRNPREVNYRCGDMVANVYNPNETVCEPDGGFNIEGMLASGGLIASAESIATLFSAYSHDGTNWRDETDEKSRVSAGTLPGTISWAQRFITDDGDHIEVAILFNARTSITRVSTPVENVSFFEEQSELLRTLSGLDASLPV